MLAQSDRFSIFRYFLFSFFSFLLNFTNIIKHGFKMRTNVEGSKKNLRVGRAWTCARATTTTVEKKGSEKEVCIFKNTSDVKMYWFGKYFGHKTRRRVGESRWQRLCDCLWNGSHMVRVLPKKILCHIFQFRFVVFFFIFFRKRETESWSFVVVVVVIVWLLSLCSLYASSFSSLNEDTHFVILSFFLQKVRARVRKRTISSTEEAYHEYSCSGYSWCVLLLLFVYYLQNIFGFFLFPFSVKTDDHQSQYVYTNPMCPKEEIKCVAENEHLLHRCQAYIKILSVCSKAITLKFDFQIAFKTAQREKNVLTEMKWNETKLNAIGFQKKAHLFQWHSLSPELMHAQSTLAGVCESSDHTLNRFVNWSMKTKGNVLVLRCCSALTDKMANANIWYIIV